MSDDFEASKAAKGWQNPLGPAEGTKEEFEAETGVEREMPPSEKVTRLQDWLGNLESSNADRAVRLQAIHELFVALQEQREAGGDGQEVRLHRKDIKRVTDHLELLRSEAEKEDVQISLRITG